MADEHSASLSEQQQQQQQPAQTPTGTHGFFATLLRPLYSSPRSLPHRDSNGNFDTQLTLSASSQDFPGGRGSTTTTPSVSPATALPNTRHACEVNSAHDSSAARPNAGLGPNRHHFTNTALTTPEGDKSAMANSAKQREYARNHPSQQQPLLSSSQKSQQQQQHGSGACAPHMLGYRQCLEVNPDFKTNCTWALDNYMRCKEDMEM